MLGNSESLTSLLSTSNLCTWFGLLTLFTLKLFAIYTGFSTTLFTGVNIGLQTSFLGSDLGKRKLASFKLFPTILVSFFFIILDLTPQSNVFRLDSSLPLFS